MPDSREMSRLWVRRTHERWVIQEIDEEVIAYDPATQQAHALSASAARLFHACEATQSAKKLMELCESKFEARGALLALLDAGLLESLGGRRNFVRNALTGTAFVATIAIPNAAAAQSCSGELDDCSTIPCCSSLTCVDLGPVRACVF
ncbi:MAG: hypothetical protein ACI9KE_001903 [Polyangiales bacterium]|jgi:hypothetical protein